MAVSSIVSKPLIFYRRLVGWLDPVKSWIKGFYAFTVDSWYLKWSLIFIFLLAINALPVVVDALSWYFYFVSSFDLASMYKFVVVIFLDLYKFLTFFHWIFYVVLAYFIFDLIRINRAYKALNHYENYNKGFIKSTGIVVIIDGTPGSGKTELMTDMMLSADQIFRDDVFGIMKEVDNLFPHFPFRLLEIDVEKNMEGKIFHNRTHVTDYFKKKFSDNDYYGYDFNKYEYYAYVGLKLEHISEALLDYAQAYFCYVMSCSFLLCNYSIRTDGVQIDRGHLKVWDYDFFKSDYARFVFSRFSKNLPFDALRYGKQVIQSNPDSFVLDNCIVAVTEIDKERLNTPMQQSLDINAAEANQRNDKFNDSLKTGRHPATIRFRTLYKFFGDLQRIGSLNSDLHELSSTHIHVSTKNDFKISIPMYWIEPAICEWLLGLLEGLYYRFRVNRSDNTFLINLVRVLKSFIYKYYYKRLNTFGYWPLSLLISDGSMKEEINVPQKYFLMKKKIHNDRYSSDAYSEFFAEKYRAANRGFIDLAEFQSSKATPQELRYEESYFIGVLDRKQESDDSFFKFIDDKQESVIVDEMLDSGDSAITL
jgi:hypothetical protein